MHGVDVFPAKWNNKFLLDLLILSDYAFFFSADCKLCRVTAVQLLLLFQLKTTLSQLERTRSRKSSCFTTVPSLFKFLVQRMLTVTVAAPPPPLSSFSFPEIFWALSKKNRPFLEMDPGLGVGVRSCGFLNFKSSVQTNGLGMCKLVVQFLFSATTKRPPSRDGKTNWQSGVLQYVE